jgi:hypothetical protein
VILFYQLSLIISQIFIRGMTLTVSQAYQVSFVFIIDSKNRVDYRILCDLGPPSIFSRLSNHTTVTCSPRNKAKRAESLVSVRSGTSSVRSGGSSNLRIIECQGNNHVVPRTVAVLLKLQYSGGPGYIAGFCRSNGVGLTVEILPSVIITKWDVLPAETPSHCYLVLDILNATQHGNAIFFSLLGIHIV